MKIAAMKMSEVPASWKPRLKDLTVEGFWAMSRWLYQNGECYTAVIFDGEPGEPLIPDLIAGWAVITFEDGPHAVLGAYVGAYRRGRGYAQAAIQMLLQLHSERIRASGGVVNAVAERWSKYPGLIEAAGFKHEEWE